MDIHTTTYARRLRVLLLTAIISTAAFSQDIIYEKEDSVFFENVIKEHSSTTFPEPGDRIISIAKEFYGKKYISGTLDRYNDEPLFISCNELDCTTFVETVLALSITEDNESFDSVCQNLERIRYRNGKRCGYTSRLHYISWWIADSAKQETITEVHTHMHTAEQFLELNFMSTHPENYRHLQECPEAIEKIAEYERAFNKHNIRYIPKSDVAGLSRNEIRNGDIIAIVTDIDGLDVTHIGFACWYKENLHMIHASSIHKSVIFDTAPLATYLDKRKSHKGIRIFRAR